MEIKREKIPMPKTKKKPWNPPDAVALQMLLRKKRIENPDARYFQLRVLKKYRVGQQIDIQNYNKDVTLFANQDHNMWLIIKAYFPVESETKRFKGLQKRTSDGSSFDRVAVKVPKKFHIEIESNRLWPVKVRKELHEEIHKNFREFFTSLYNENGNTYHLITEKNWDYVTDDPNTKNSVFEVSLDSITSPYPY